MHAVHLATSLQAVIPVTMMLSVLRHVSVVSLVQGSAYKYRSSSHACQVMLLRKQYHMLQYLGATTIVMGIVLDKAVLSQLVERISVEFAIW